MFGLHRRKRKGEVLIEPPTQIHRTAINYNYEASTQPKNHYDRKILRLMELISCAIEDWATEFHLENLPKRIIFQQALDAMRAIELAINSKEE